MSSCGAKDIGGLSENVGSDVRAQSFHSHQIDPGTKDVFEEIGQVQESLESLLSGGEFDEQIHVTVKTAFTASDRSEQRESAYSEGSDPRTHGFQPVSNLFRRRDGLRLPGWWTL